METQFISLTVIEVIDMLISGKEKLATELVKEMRKSDTKRNTNS